MIKIYTLSINRLNDFLKEKKKLTNGLLNIFDWSSQFTYLVLFNPLGYISFVLALFFIPVYYSKEVIDFLSLLLKEPSNFILCFNNLPLTLKILFSFFFIILELVFLCTFLASIPLIKEKMVEKYKDNLILKKRKYNTLTSSLKRAATLGVPLTAAIVVTGDVSQHSITVGAILEKKSSTLGDIQNH